jgi:CheY-like chemotaxis protein
VQLSKDPARAVCGFKDRRKRNRSAERNRTLSEFWSIFCDMLSKLVLSNVTIVIVEDDPDTRFSLTQFLHHQGANVVASADAFDGLVAVKEHRPKLVFSDISLPHRDGFTLLGDIRALGTDGGGGVPVIAMTAFSGIVDPSRTIAAGFQAHVNKPFGPEELLEAIKLVLKD